MGKVLERQGYHLLAFLLLGALLLLAARELPASERRLLGLDAPAWAAVSWVFAGLSQAWVAFFWRLELHGGRISARLGRKAGFALHRAGYVALFACRFLPLLPLSLLSAGTIPAPHLPGLVLLVLTTPPILWAVFGALVYFGLDRLAGADHFDPVYRTLGLEQRGIYRYVPNAAYAVGILALFHPGLLWHSALSLVVAAAHWALVWVHYFCTEKPDLEVIYGGGAPAPQAAAPAPGPGASP